MKDIDCILYLRKLLWFLNVKAARKISLHMVFNYAHRMRLKSDPKDTHG